MSNTLIRSLNDPVITILQYSTQSQMGQVMNPDLQMILNQFPIPSFTMKDISTISANRQQGLSYADSFKNVSYNFPYKPEVLNSIIRINIANNNNDFEAVSRFVLFSYISYLFSIEKAKTDIPGFQLLFDSLLYITRPSNSETVKDAFFYAFYIFIGKEYENERNTDDNFDLILLILKSFLIKAGNSTSKTGSFLENALVKLHPDQSHSFSNNAAKFISLISELIDVHKFTFSAQSAEHMILMTSRQLLSFDIYSFLIFGSLSKFVKEQTLSQIVEMISNTLNIKVNQSPFDIKFDIPETPSMSAEDQTSQPFSFPTIETFVGGFDINSEIPKFNYMDKYNELIPTEFSEKVAALAQSLRKQPELLIQLVNSIGKNAIKSQKEYVTYALLIVFYYEIKRIAYVTPKVVPYIPISKIFNKNIICLRNAENEKEEKELLVLKSLRHLYLGIIIEDSETTLASLLADSGSSPFFFQELLVQLIEYKSKIINILISTKALLKPISNAISYVKRLRYEGNKEMDQIRTLFLQFIQIIITNFEVQKNIFDDMTFVSMYFTFLFDLPVRYLILSQISNFMKNSPEISQSAIIATVSSIIEMMRTDLSKDCNVQLIIDLVKTMNEVLEEKPTMTRIFNAACAAIFDAFQNVIKSEKCIEFFIESIHFFIRVSTTLTINIRFKELFKKATEILFDNHPPRVILDEFVHLMLLNFNATTQSTDKILHPALVSILFESFCQTEFFDEIVDFFDRLLDDQYNISVCNSSNFDKLLMMKYSSSFPDNIKKLFTKMMLTYTSNSVVLNYISMLSPIGKNTFPSNIPFLLNYMQELLRLSLENQREIVIIDGNSLTKPQNILINKKFSYCCWIYLLKMIPQYYPQIFSAYDEKGHLIELFLSMQKIRVQIDPERESKSIELNHQIPSNKWVFLTISFNDNFDEANKDDKNNCTVSIDMSLDGQTVVSTNFDRKYMIDGKCKFSFCGCLQQSLCTSSLTVVGPYAVFDFLDDKTINNLMEEEQRFFGRNQQTPLYVFQPYKLGPRQNQYSFSSILVMKCRLEILCPLFKFIGYKFEDGSSYDGFLDTVFSIFKSSFHFGEAVEESFTYSKGFGIIGQILLENERCFLTYDLYLHFYDLLTTLQNEKLMSHLLDSILVNIQLWVISSFDEQMQIYNHWMSTLFPKYIEIISQTKNFINFLNEIMLNFHAKTDYSIIKAHFQNQIPEDFNCENCLQVMFEILFISAKYYFKIHEFALVISYMLKTESCDLIALIINLLKKLILEEPSPMTNIFARKKALSLVHYVFKNGNSEASRLMVEVVILLHQKGIITDISLNNHIDMILKEIPKDSLDGVYLDTLIEILKNGVYEVFPLCCWVAANLPLGEGNRLLEGLEPSEKFVIHKFWALWPIVLALKSDQAFSVDIMKFIAMCSLKTEEWVKIYGLIELICNMLRKPSSGLKGAFIRRILASYNKDGRDFLKENTQFVKMIFNYMFYRDIKYESLANMFNKSPFAELKRSFSLSFSNNPGINTQGNNQMKKKTDIKRSLSLSFHSSNPVDDIIKVFEGPAPPSRNYMFGARFDANGKWADRDIANKVLHFLFYAKTPYFVQFKLMVLFFILHDNEDTRVFDYARSINLSEELKEPLQELIDLVCFRLQINNYKDLRLYNLMSEENFRENGLSFYENIPKLKTEEEEAALMKEIRKFSQKSSVLSDKYLSVPIDNYVNSVDKSQKSTFSIILDNEMTHYKCWKTLFESLSIQKAPWQALAPETRHYKRDPTRCFGGCPIRMRENWHYRNHANDSPDNYDSSWSKTADFNIRDRFSNCQVITFQSTIDATIIINEKDLRLSLINNKVKKYYLKHISKCWRTTVIHRNTAFEVTFVDGDSFIVNFPSDSLCSSFYDKLTPFAKPLTIPTADWLCGNISNFEYIMALNYASCRSFNNCTQYPIFPWVLSDYKSPNLDLSNDVVFRDLSKPVGALSSEKLKLLVEKMTANNNGDESSIFLYSEAMNNPRIVLDYLARIEPYSTLNIDINKGNIKKIKNFHFDSISGAFDSVLRNLDDNRELIPEFFFSAEFLIDRTPREEGEVGNNLSLNDVELPPWASSPIDFVYKNRKALESEYVSQRLNQWIDLIWGFKQKGPDSLDNFNNFQPILYDNALKNAKTLETAKRIESTKVWLGQIPKQLFDLPHECRRKVTDEGMKAFTIRTDLKNLNFASIYNESESQFSVLTIDENWRKCTIHLTHRDSDFTHEIDRCDFYAKIPIKKVRFSGFNEKIIIAGGMSSVITEHQITHASKRYLCVATDKKWMLTICSDSVIYLFSNENVETPKRRLHFYRETPTCACVSSRFHLFIIGTKDGCLSIYPLEKGSTIRTVDLKDSYVPRKVVITPSWGFIITYAAKLVDGKRSYALFAHTISGVLIRTYSLTAEITAITALRSKSGFDYVAVASRMGAVFVFEAYSLAFDKPTMKLDSPIINILYNQKMKTLIAVSVDGTIICQSIELIIS